MGSQIDKITDPIRYYDECFPGQSNDTEGALEKMTFDSSFSFSIGPSVSAVNVFTLMV